MTDTAPHGSALEGVKVLDLMWVIAGPTATRYLADYGATVIRVESSTRIDGARTIGPFHGAEAGPENSAIFSNMNTNKYGLTLNLASSEGRAVIKDLVRWADIVTESFSPGAMYRSGLDYAALREIKQVLIMLSTCLFGQTGPLSGIAGFGTMGSAIAGFVNLAGGADQPPVGPYGAYTDYLAPRFTVCALLAALDYRNRTGQGPYLDPSQVESAMHFLSPALLDYEVNGRLQGRDGNHDTRRVPHGIYPALGDDEWVAIAVETDDQWDDFCEASFMPALGGNPRFDSFENRKQHEESLDEIIAAWSAQLPADEIVQTLQAVGVAAYVVQGSNACYADPQLQHRGEFVEVDHPTLGRTTVEGSRFHLSRTPAQYRRSAPTFGRDNEFVLKDVLGYDDEQITDLVIAGALE